MPIYKCHSNLRIANRRGGFTLLEMLVAVELFATVLVIAVGAVLALSQAQRKAANIQNIQDNLRFALESMTREIRTGSSFLLPAASGCPPACPELTFTRSDGVSVGYCLASDALRKIGGMSCALSPAISDETIIVEQLVFYIIGQTIGPGDGQPRITVSLRARSSNPLLATTFRLQTTVTQRAPDQ